MAKILRSYQRPVQQSKQGRILNKQGNVCKCVACSCLTGEVTSTSAWNITNQNCMNGESGPGYLGRYSDILRDGRSGDRIPVGVRLSAHVQTGLGAYPYSNTVGTGTLSLG